jgi:hypothetical protein
VAAALSPGLTGAREAPRAWPVLLRPQGSVHPDAGGASRQAHATRLVEFRPSRALLITSLLAVAAEVTWIAFGFHLAWGPTMPVLPSAIVVPALALLWVRALGPVTAGSGTLARPATTGLALVLGVVAAAAMATAGWAVTVELALASAAEEVVYRVALPVAIVALARRWLAPQPAAWMGVALSCLAFTLLPGHLIQLVAGGPAVVVTFVGMTALWALVLWSTGSLGLVVTVHVVVNLSVLPVEAGALPLSWRAVTVVGVLILLAWAVKLRQRGLALGGERAPNGGDGVVAPRSASDPDRSVPISSVVSSCARARDRGRPAARPPPRDPPPRRGRRGPCLCGHRGDRAAGRRRHRRGR